MFRASLYAFIGQFQANHVSLGKNW